MVMDFRDWATWLRQCPAAIVSVVRLVSEAEASLDAFQRTTFNRLWGKLLAALRGQGVTAQQAQNYWRGVLALAIIDLGAGAHDQAILLQAQGVEVGTPAPERQLQDQALLSSIFTAAEDARNGRGGPNPPRRAQ